MAHTARPTVDDGSSVFVPTRAMCPFCNLVVEVDKTFTPKDLKPGETTGMRLKLHLPPLVEFEGLTMIEPAAPRKNCLGSYAKVLHLADLPAGSLAGASPKKKSTAAK